jgi:hypothetical protein
MDAAITETKRSSPREIKRSRPPTNGLEQMGRLNSARAAAGTDPLSDLNLCCRCRSVRSLRDMPRADPDTAHSHTARPSMQTFSMANFFSISEWCVVVVYDDSHKSV